MIGDPPLRWERQDGGWDASVFVISPYGTDNNPDWVKLTLAKIRKHGNGWSVQPCYRWFPKPDEPMHIAKNAINAVHRIWEEDGCI